MFGGPMYDPWNLSTELHTRGFLVDTVDIDLGGEEHDILFAGGAVLLGGSAPRRPCPTR